MNKHLNRNYPKIVEPEPKTTVQPRLYWRKFKYPEDGNIENLCAKEDKHEYAEFPFDHVDSLRESTRAFNAYTEVTKRYLGSYVFWSSLRRSEFVYLCDHYFDEKCFKRLCEELTISLRARDGLNFCTVRIFTGVKGVKAASTDPLSSKLPADIQVYILQERGLTNKAESHVGIHDRIALLQSGIWHCGATVAGMHPHLNALSGPWPDTNGKLKAFFENLESFFK